MPLPGPDAAAPARDAEPGDADAAPHREDCVGELVRELAGHSDWVNALWAHDDRVYSASCDGTVRVWSKDGAVYHSLSSGGAAYCVLTVRTPTLGRIIVAGGKGEAALLRRWRDGDGTPLDPGDAGPAEEEGVGGGCVATWALATWDGVVFAGGTYRAIRAVCAETGRLLFRLDGHTASVNCLAIEEENLLHSGGDDMVIRSWDLVQRRPRQSFKGHASSVLCLAVGKTMLYSGAYDGQIRAWNRHSGHTVQTFDGHGAFVGGLKLRDAALWSCGGDGVVLCWSTTSGACIHRIDAHHDAVSGIASADSDPLLYSASRDGTVRCWQLRGADGHHHPDDTEAASDSEGTVGPSRSGVPASQVAADRRLCQLEHEHQQELEALRCEFALKLAACAGERETLRRENRHLHALLRRAALENQRLLNAPAGAPAAPPRGGGDDSGSARSTPVPSPGPSPAHSHPMLGDQLMRLSLAGDATSPDGGAVRRLSAGVLPSPGEVGTNWAAWS